MRLSRRSLFAATTTALAVPHAAWAQEKVVRYGISMAINPAPSFIARLLKMSWTRPGHGSYGSDVAAGTRRTPNCIAAKRPAMQSRRP